MSYKHITINERCCIVEYLNLGWSLSKIAKELGSDYMSYKHITINERCCIVEYLNLGWSLSKIAKELGTNK